MPIQPDLRLFERLLYKLDEVCQCGRDKKSVHCPACGSSDVRVRSRVPKNGQVLSSSYAAQTPDGDYVPCRVFKCRRCAESFAESDCFRTCHSLPLPTYAKKTAEVEHVVRTLTPQGRALLEDFYKKHPERRLQVVEPQREPSTLEIADEERKKRKLDEGGES